MEVMLILGLLLAVVLLYGVLGSALKKVKDLEGKIEEFRRRAIEAERNAVQRASEILKRREKEMRADAVRRSAATVKGKVAEQFVPFADEFEYNPRDCRFLGSPIDFVVFAGLTEGKVNEIVLVEVKSGRSSRLSVRERQVRSAVQAGRVEFKTLRAGGKQDAKEPSVRESNI